MEREKQLLEAVVFDLDDTLMPCKEYYVRARAELLVWMSEVFSPLLSAKYGIDTEDLAEKARLVQRTVETEGSLTRDVYEIIDDLFERDEAGGTTWEHLKIALDLHNDSRQTESVIKRTRTLQEQKLVISQPYLRPGLELLRNTSPISLSTFVLAAMAHAFKMESSKDYQEFKKQGKQFSTERFPTSCRKTYIQMCEFLEAIPEWKHIHKAAAIGRKAFDIEEELMPGAEGMLDYLKLLGVGMALLTKGPTDEQDNVQLLKYHVNRLDRWIPEDDVEIVTAKTPAHYADLLGNTSPENSLAIGNDYDADLHPAHQLGMHTIWIPLETWLLDSSEHLDSEAGQPFLAEDGIFGWRTREGLYTFQIESAEHVPALLAEYFSR